MKYLHEHPDWPNFIFDEVRLARMISPIRFRQGHLIGQMSRLGFEISDTLDMETISRDIVSSSNIEGVIVSLDAVRSSVSHRLGLERGGIDPVNRDIEGLVDLMLDATRNFGPLTKDRICGWQAALFPTGYSGMYKIRTGDYRKSEDGAMQIVSGPVGREKVHYVAPDADRLDYEMTRFLGWINGEKNLDPVIKAGIAHLWFVSLHPFEDGNGRVARALADHVLAKSEGVPMRFYSISTEINANRKEYYRILEKTQTKELDITEWLEWMAETVDRSVRTASVLVDKVIQKVADINVAKDAGCNDRQLALIHRLHEGFKGDLTSEKYSKIAKCSAEEAQEELKHLSDLGILCEFSPS